MKYHNKIEIYDINEIKPYGKNPKTHPLAQIELLKKQFQDKGFVGAVWIDENNELIAGHARLEALKELKETKIPAIKVTGLTEQQKIELRISDNKSTELGVWDYDILYSEIKALEKAGYDLDLTGFSETEINSILDNNQKTDLPESDFVGDFQDFNEVLIISIDDSNQRDIIKGFFDLPMNKKSMRGNEAVEVIRRKCSNS